VAGAQFLAAHEVRAALVTMAPWTRDAESRNGPCHRSVFFTTTGYRSNPIHLPS